MLWCTQLRKQFGWGTRLRFAARRLSVAALPSLFNFSLVNEQGSAVITAIPAMRVQINGGAWQTLAAAAISVSVVSGKLRLSGFTGAETSVLFHYEQQQGTNEAYNAVDTVATANTTGTSINAIYAIHATGPKPVLGAVTPNLLPGLPLVSTRQNIPVVGT